MAEEFNVNQYWLTRGKTYINEQRLASPYHRVQEQFLLDIQAHLPTGKILELGCGFGRITRLLAEHFPSSQITALDLSPDQLKHATNYCAGCGNVSFQQYDFYSSAPFPETNYDVAIAIEVFLHHPAEMVLGLIARLSGVARVIVNIDWSEDWPWTTPEHVWVHDYGRLYREAGLECAAFQLPEKVEGKQQKLFIAAKQISSEIRRLEAEVQAITRPGPPPAASNAAEAADWLAQLHCAREEILNLVPPESTCILVNDDQWGDERMFPRRRMIPFLERDGQYWGPPADDETAIRELERLRRAGAQYIIFGWNAFWWLDHYSRFAGYLRSTFPCLAQNERLIVFNLKPNAQ